MFVIDGCFLQCLPHCLCLIFVSLPSVFLRFVSGCNISNKDVLAVGGVLVICVLGGSALSGGFSSPTMEWQPLKP